MSRILTSEEARAMVALAPSRKGKVSIQTKQKLLGQKRITSRVYRMTDKLINAQAIVALGTHKIVCLSKDIAGKTIVETINDIVKIEELINTGEYGKDYLIVIGTMPDWRASDALLNRAYGKPKETLELEGEVKFSLKDLAQRRLAEAKHVEVIDAEPEENLPVVVTPELTDQEKVDQHFKKHDASIN